MRWPRHGCGVSCIHSFLSLSFLFFSFFSSFSLFLGFPSLNWQDDGWHRTNMAGWTEGLAGPLIIKGPVMRAARRTADILPQKAGRGHRVKSQFRGRSLVIITPCPSPTSMCVDFPFSHPSPSVSFNPLHRSPRSPCCISCPYLAPGTWLPALGLAPEPSAGVCCLMIKALPHIVRGKAIITTIVRLQTKFPGLWKEGQPRTQPISHRMSALAIIGACKPPISLRSDFVWRLLL